MKDFFLFHGMTEQAIAEILDQLPEPVTIQKGNVINDDTESSCIGIILQGNARCFVKDSDVIMRTFSSGDMFGATNLFEQNDVSTIIATATCKVLFISRSQMQNLLKTNNLFSMNYIKFLTERVCFLNDKILLYSMDNAERKVYMYLLDNADSEGQISIKNMSMLAKTLGIGRTSLYRAFEQLCSKKIITKSNKSFQLKELS